MRTYFLTFVSILCFGSLHGQFAKIDIWLSGGLPAIIYEDFYGNRTPKISPAGGIGYKYFFNDNWAAKVGLDFAANNSVINNPSLQYTLPSVDSEGEKFDLNVKLNEYKESHNFNTVNMPVNLYYYMHINNYRIFVSGGLKVCVPLARYKTNIGNLTTTGYYPGTNVELENLPKYGFGTLQNVSATCNLRTNVGIATTTELGVDFDLSKKSSVFICCFFDYGLNTIANKANSKTYIIEYKEGVKINNSNMFDAGFASGARIMTFGLKVGMSFSL